MWMVERRWAAGSKHRLSMFLVLALLLAVQVVAAAHATPARADSSQAQAIVNAAQGAKNAGYPYCFDGGTTSGPSVGINDAGSDGSYSNCAQTGKVGFDCTGLTLFAVYQGTGNARLSHDGHQPSSGGGQVISTASDLLPGDVVYFDHNTSNALSSIDHAGIYMGSGQVLSAASEKYGIVTESLAWYASGDLHFVGGVRYWSGGSPPSSGSSPVGSLDAVAGQDGGFVAVSGWALDPDAPTTPTTVHVYVDGPAGSGGTMVGSAAASIDREDVAAANPGAGGLHGFDDAVGPISAGTHSVYVYGIDVAGGNPNALLGWTTVTVPTAVAGTPYGSFDSAAAHLPGGVTVSGWTIDPDAPTVPTDVHIYVDSWPGSSGGFASDIGPANQSRQDVAASYPSAGPNHGFSAVVTGLAPGTHTVWAYAINAAGSGANPLLRTFTITIPPDGTFDVTGVSSASRAQGAALAHVTVTGAGFSPGVALSAPGMTFSNVTVVDAEHLTAQLAVATNAPLGPAQLTLTDPSGTTFTCGTCLTVTAPPTIVGLSPSTAKRGSQTTVVLTGTNLARGLRVTLSGAGATVISVTWLSPTKVRVTVKVTGTAKVGKRTLTVSNRDGGSAALPAGLQVV